MLLKTYNYFACGQISQSKNCSHWCVGPLNKFCHEKENRLILAVIGIRASVSQFNGIPNESQ